MIQVFSKRIDKPKQYGYGEFGPVYTPVEYATSTDGVTTLLILKTFSATMLLTYRQLSELITLKRLAFKMVLD